MKHIYNSQLLEREEIHTCYGYLSKHSFQSSSILELLTNTIRTKIENCYVGPKLCSNSSLGLELDLVVGVFMSNTQYTIIYIEDLNLNFHFNLTFECKRLKKNNKNTVQKIIRKCKTNSLNFLLIVNLLSSLILVALYWNCMEHENVRHSSCRWIAFHVEDYFGTIFWTRIFERIWSGSFIHISDSNDFLLRYRLHSPITVFRK